MNRWRIPSMAAMLLAASAAAVPASASEVEVRIVNLTRGQVFSPVIAWTHNGRFGPFFGFGGVASEELRAIAEDGNPDPMNDALAGDPNVTDIEIAEGPLPPGGSITLTLDTGRNGRFLSLASMLVNTNDTFFALRNERIPRRRTEFFQPGLDAGTEDNNEDCAFIPGPACADIDPGNIALDDDGEGFIFTQEGIHGPEDGPETSDLDPGEQDWRNPVAYIVVTPTGRGR